MEYKSVDLCVIDNKMHEQGYRNLVQTANEIGNNGFHISHMDYYADQSVIGRIYYTEKETTPTICDNWNVTEPWSISKLEAMAFLAAEHTEEITGVRINNNKVEFIYGTDEDQRWEAT